jgi:hypothetical protein
MFHVRRIATLGTAAVMAFTLFTVPASATTPPKHEYARYAVIDCGSGPITVGSTNALWTTLTDVETGQKYKPVAFDVAGEGFAVSVSKNQTKGSKVCSYDDGEATGTVTVRKI